MYGYMCILWCFGDGISFCTPGWSETHYVAQACFKFMALFGLQLLKELRLQVRATMHGFYLFLTFSKIKAISTEIATILWK